MVVTELAVGHKPEVAGKIREIFVGKLSTPEHALTEDAIFR